MYSRIDSMVYVSVISCIWIGGIKLDKTSQLGNNIDKGKLPS